MKKLLLIATVFLMFTTPVLADATAIISRNEPLDNVVLNGSNNYEVKKEFDGTPSSPDDATYSWSWVENSISKSGDKVNFTFDRSAPSGTDQPQTIQLTVSDGGDSNTTSVTQPLRDVPNASISANPSSLDLDNDDTVDFSSTVTNEFNTPDGGIDYNWTINGTQEDTTSNFSKTFSDTGTYTVKLNVTDAKNYSSVTSLDYDVTNSSDSGNNNNNNNNNEDNGGGGGGGGLSGGGYDFLHTIAGNVTDGENEEIDVNTQAFRKLSFTATENITEPEFGVNVQDDRPSPATTDPNGELYVYMELDEENISSGDVENVEIEFRVDDTWVESRNLSTEDIHLMRYDGGWNQLETTYEEDKNGYMHFTADSPGLSVFAVSGFKSNIQVKDISLSSDSIQAFDSFDIDVTFENTASGSGWEEFNITVGESSYTTNVSLDSGAEETVSFTESLAAGDYTVEAGTETLDFTVQSSSSGSDDLTTQESDETGSENEDGTNQSSTEGAQVQDSGLPVLLIVAGIGVFIIIFGGAATYLKKDEIEEFMETHELKPQIELVLPSSSSEAEKGLQVADRYSDIKDSIEEMGVNDPEIEVKMDHAKMLINQGEEAEAAEVLEEVTDRVLDYEEDR